MNTWKKWIAALAVMVMVTVAWAGTTLPQGPRSGTSEKSAPQGGTYGSWTGDADNLGVSTLTNFNHSFYDGADGDYTYTNPGGVYVKQGPGDAVYRITITFEAVPDTDPTENDFYYLLEVDTQGNGSYIELDHGRVS